MPGVNNFKPIIVFRYK